MPKPRKPRTKGPRPQDGLEGNAGDGSPVAVAEPPSDELQPPTTPVETHDGEKTAEKPPERRPERASVEDKDRVAATSLNIAKLQAMSMGDLNQMARDLGV